MVTVFAIKFIWYRLARGQHDNTMVCGSMLVSSCTAIAQPCFVLADARLSLLCIAQYCRNMQVSKWICLWQVRIQKISQQAAACGQPAACR
jgi:hypothetical protein